MPLRSPLGHTIGTLGALDVVPRSLTAGELATLEELAAAVVDELEPTRERAELKQAQIQTQQVLDATRAGFFAVDRQGRITHMNEAAEAMLHRRREEVLGVHLVEVFPESESTSFYDVYQRALRDQVAVQFEDYYPPFERWFERGSIRSKEG